LPCHCRPWWTVSIFLTSPL